MTPDRSSVSTARSGRSRVLASASWARASAASAASMSAGHQLGGGDREVGRAGRPGALPAVQLGERDRLAGEPRGARVVVLRAGQDREVRGGGQRQPGPAGLLGRGPPALEVARGGLQVAGPQLGDPEVRQRQRAQVGLDDAGLQAPGLRELAARGERRVEVAAQAREVEPDRGERDLEAMRGAPRGPAPASRSARRSCSSAPTASPRSSMPLATASASSGSASSRAAGIRSTSGLSTPISPRISRSIQRSPARRAARSQSPASTACRRPARVVAVLGQPDRRAAVQPGELAGPLAAQLGPQQLGEQRVIAVPLPPAVDRGQQRAATREARRACDGRWSRR